MQTPAAEEKRSLLALWLGANWPWLLAMVVLGVLFVPWVRDISYPERQATPLVSLRPYGLSAFNVWVDCPKRLNGSHTGKQNKRITVYVQMLAPSDIESLEFVIRSSPANVVRFVDEDGNSVSSPVHRKITPSLDENVPRHVRVAHANTDEADRAKEAHFTVSVITPEGAEAEIEELAFAVEVESRLGRVFRNFREGNLAPVLAIVSWLIAFANEIKKGKEREREKKIAPLKQSVIIVDILLTGAVVAMFLWPQPPATIKIGLQVPLTGPLTDQGQGFLSAVALPADQINEKGGLLDGREIEIVAVDDKGDPGEAARAANKLVEKDVVAVIGSYESSATEAAAAIYDEAGILHITPSATIPQLTTKGYDRFFRLAFPDDRRSLFATAFMVDALHTQKAAIIHDNSPSAKTLADWAEIYLERQGTNVAAIETIDRDKIDTTLMMKMESVAPDTIYFAGYTPLVDTLLAQSKDLGLESKWTMAVDASYLDLITAGPDVVAGVYFVTDPLFEDFVTDPLFDDIVNPKSKEFFQDFMAKYGEPPTDISWARAADAFQLIVNAIEAKQSISAEVLAEYIQDIQDFPGISGTIAGFDKEGDRLGAADYAVYAIDKKGNLLLYQPPY